MRDIDLIIEKVKERNPEITFRQHYKIHPADDDGIWWFYFPYSKIDIHVESSYGMCPFIIETNEQSSYDARTANTVDETVEMIVEYLESKTNG